MTATPSLPIEHVFYMHVVSYYVRKIPAPISTCLNLGKRLEQTVGVKRIDVLALAEQLAPPDSHWEPVKPGVIKDTTDWCRCYHSAPEGCAGVERLTGGINEHRIERVLFFRGRRGTKMKMVDYDWSIDYEQENNYPQLQNDTDLAITVRLELFADSPKGRAAVRELATDLVNQALAAGECYYLLVDIANLNETGGHCLYTRDGNPVLTGWCLARVVERRIWHELREERRKHVRGVFWGNYLNPSHLERLGGKDSFRKRYLAYVKATLPGLASVSAEYVTEIEGGGLFVRISRDPRDNDPIVRGISGGEYTAAWLHTEFRRAGLLI